MTHQLDGAPVTPLVPCRQVIVGESAAIRRVREHAARLALTASTALVTGESGTGKELVARALHAQGPRRHQPFVPINCGAIPESLLEGQLFGHVRGAFTSAVQANPGLFVAADRGTLFLDEVAELPSHLQVKLVRVLEDREIWPVGGTTPVVVDVRVVAATHRDLAGEIGAGRFRPDLFYRLNVARIELPPLRERVEDIPLLVRHLLSRLNAKLGTACTDVDGPALEALTGYAWPGNVRELENVLERALVLSDRPVITRGVLPAELRAIPPGAPSTTLRQKLADFEQRYVREVLARVNLDKKEAARLLGISVSSLYRKLDRRAGG